MAALPVTVTKVERLGGATWAVHLMYADGSTGWYVVPDSLANVEDVTISAAAVAVLSQRPVPVTHGRHGRQQRYAPRP